MNPEIFLKQADPIFLQHPIFQLQNDPFFSLVLKPLISLLGPQNIKSNFDLTKWLMDNILHNEKTVFMQEPSLFSNPICGRVIEKGEVFYWCIDCEIPGKSNILISLCADCYAHSNHDGHRIINLRHEGDYPTNCTCGDDYYIKPENFCVKHQPRHFDVKECLRHFPEEKLERFYTILPKVFYAIVAFFDIAKATKGTKAKRIFDSFAQKLTKDVLEFCTTCYSQIDQRFLLVFAVIFKDNFKNPYNKVWHNCDNFKGDNKENFEKHPRICNCTILGNLLRLGNIFEREQQFVMSKLALECSREASFQEFAAVEFTKYSFYLYGQDYFSDQAEDTINSVLSGLVAEYNVRESLRIKVLNSGYFHNLIEIISNAISSFSEINIGIYYVVGNVARAMLCFLEVNFESTERMLKDTDLLKEMTEIINIFQTKLFYEKDIHNNLDIIKIYSTLSFGFMVEKSLCSVIETAIQIICEYPPSTRTFLVKNFIKNWHDNFEKASAMITGEVANEIICFHLGLERIFSFMIAKYFQQNHMQGIEEFIGEILPQSELKKIARNILTSTLKVLGMMRHLRLRNMEIDGQNFNLYYSIFGLYEADIMSIQTMSLISDSEDLFEIFYNNFFYYNEEIQKFFRQLEPLKKGRDFKQKVSLIQDFLNFLIYTMNDELGLLNLTVEDPDTFSRKNNKNPRFNAVVKKTLVNILLGSYWIEYSALKELRKGVLKEEFEFDAILAEIAIIEQDTHRIRIKEEYYPDFDPYMFYRNPSLQSKIVQVFTPKVKDNQQIDLVAGKYYDDLPVYLKSVQRKLFMSKLPDFLSQFIMKFTGETISLMHPILKLILLNLQIIDEALKSKDDSIKDLMEKVHTHYITAEFSNALHEIAQNDRLQDCRSCIDKIQNLMKSLSSDDQKLHSPSKESNDQKEQTQENTKEKLAKARMQKIKEEFAKKQALFANKNVNADKTGDLQLDGDSITCQYCLEKLKQGTDLYGIPIYIALTNNMHNTTVTNDNHISQGWWSVVSSCHHYYHKKCFETVNKNSRSSRDSARFLFTNPLETYCPLCKTLCNYFICVGPEDKTLSNLQIKGETFEIYSSLSKALSIIFKSSIPKPNHGPNMNITMDFLRNSYNYFLEGFHINSRLDDLKKFFSLYKNFLKDLGNNLIISIKEEKLQEKSLSFIETIIDKNGGIERILDQKGFNNKSLWTYECETIINEIFFDILKEKILLSSNKKLMHLKEHLTSKIAQSAILQEENKSLSTKTQDDNDLFSSIMKQCIFPIDKFALAPWINRRQKLKVYEEINESVLFRKQISVLKDYLTFKICQSVTFERLNELSNTEILQEILKKILFPLQKIALASWMNKSILSHEQSVPEDLWALLCRNQEDDSLDYVESLFKIIEPSLTVDNLINEIYSEIQNRPNDQIVLLNTMLMAGSNNETEIPRITKIAKMYPRMVELPQNYAEFVTIYFKTKCNLCNKISKHLNGTICLICGVVLCEVSCDQSRKPLGNLNVHAQQCHGGLGIFLEVQYLRQIVVNCPLNSVYVAKHVYIDQFGQSAHVVIEEIRNTNRGKLVNFKNFILNQEFTRYVKDIIYQHSMGKEVFKRELPREERTELGYL